MELKNLISLKPHRNYTATIFAFVLLILIVFHYIISFERITNNLNTYEDNSKFNYLFMILWILYILSIIWTYKIAKQTGRDPGIWIFIGFLTGPIALSIISLKDYKIANDELLDAISRTRYEFQSKLKDASNTESKNEIEKQYINLLKERSSDIITKEKVRTLKELVENGVLDKKTDIQEKERIIRTIEQNKLNDTEIENWSTDWIENDELCPACGSKLDDSSDNCLNCGLKVK